MNNKNNEIRAAQRSNRRGAMIWQKSFISTVRATLTNASVVPKIGGVQDERGSGNTGQREIVAL